MNNATENIFDKKDCKQTESNRIKLSLLQQIENALKKCRRRYLKINAKHSHKTLTFITNRNGSIIKTVVHSSYLVCLKACYKYPIHVGMQLCIRSNPPIVRSGQLR